MLRPPKNNKMLRLDSQQAPSLAVTCHIWKNVLHIINISFYPSIHQNCPPFIQLLYLSLPPYLLIMLRTFQLLILYLLNIVIQDHRCWSKPLPSSKGTAPPIKGRRDGKASARFYKQRSSPTVCRLSNQWKA